MERSTELTRRILFGGAALLAAGTLTSEAAGAKPYVRAAVHPEETIYVSVDFPGGRDTGAVIFTVWCDIAYASTDAQLMVNSDEGVKDSVALEAGSTLKQIHQAFARVATRAVVRDAAQRFGVTLKENQISVDVI